MIKITQIDIEKEIGLILTKFKNVEYILNCIIANFVSAKESAFFDNIILNSGVMPTGNKIKVIRTICKNKNKKYDFEKLHKLLNLRNLFAHENYYMEATSSDLSGSILITIDVFMRNGEYDIVRIEDKFKEFNDLHKEVSEELRKLNVELSK